MEQQASALLRKRVNASQTAKGLWQIEATVETCDGSDPQVDLLRIIDDTAARFIASGKKLVSAAE